jgi:hypothetical protein
MLDPSAATELPPNYPAHRRRGGRHPPVGWGALSGSTDRHPIASPPPEPIGPAMSYDADVAPARRLLPLVKEGLQQA